MPPKLAPLNPLENQKAKADLIPQVHFFGQICGGIDFDTADALLCEMTVETGAEWELVYPSKQKSYQTQTTYAEKGEMFVWSHPFDLHFKVNQLSGWPKLILKIWRFNDSSSTNDLLSYGVAPLPKHGNFERIQCETWTPYGDWKYQTLSFYLGTQARLADLKTVSKHLEKTRERLFSQACGKVIIQVQVKSIFNETKNIVIVLVHQKKFRDAKCFKMISRLTVFLIFLLLYKLLKLEKSLPSLSGLLKLLS